MLACSEAWREALKLCPARRHTPCGAALGSFWEPCSRAAAAAAAVPRAQHCAGGFGGGPAALPWRSSLSLLPGPAEAAAKQKRARVHLRVRLSAPRRPPLGQGAAAHALLLLLLLVLLLLLLRCGLCTGRIPASPRPPACERHPRPPCSRVYNTARVWIAAPDEAATLRSGQMPSMSTKRWFKASSHSENFIFAAASKWMKLYKILLASLQSGNAHILGRLVPSLFTKRED